MDATQISLKRKVNTITITTEESAFFMRCDKFDYMNWVYVEDDLIDVNVYYSGCSSRITITYDAMVELMQSFHQEHKKTYPAINTSPPKTGVLISVRNITSIMVNCCTLRVQFKGGNEYKKIITHVDVSMAVYTALRALIAA